MVELKKWRYESNYIGESYTDYYVVYGHHRDSGILDESNYNYIKNALKDSPGFIEVRSSHWAVGWTEFIGIHESDSAGIDTAKDLLDRLEGYPVLDENDLSKREWNIIADIADDIENDIDNNSYSENGKYITGISSQWGSCGFTPNMTREQIEDKILDSGMVEY